MRTRLQDVAELAAMDEAAGCGQNKRGCEMRLRLLPWTRPRGAAGLLPRTRPRDAVGADEHAGFGRDRCRGQGRGLRLVNEAVECRQAGTAAIHKTAGWGRGGLGRRLGPGWTRLQAATGAVV